MARTRGLVAEARRLAAGRFGAASLRSVEGERPSDVLRRALLLREEIRSLLVELEAARGDVDREIRSMRSQTVAINAYASCRQIGRQYARDLRRKK